MEPIIYPDSQLVALLYTRYGDALSDSRDVANMLFAAWKAVHFSEHDIVHLKAIELNYVDNYKELRHAATTALQSISNLKSVVLLVADSCFVSGKQATTLKYLVVELKKYLDIYVLPISYHYSLRQLKASGFCIEPVTSSFKKYPPNVLEMVLDDIQGVDGQPPLSVEAAAKKHCVSVSSIKNYVKSASGDPSMTVINYVRYGRE